MTLTEFLLARIAEDAAMARKFDQRLVRDFGAPAATALSSELALAGADYMDYPVLTIDSTRVLAECEAKRRIMEMQAANDEDRYLPGFHYKAQMIERLLRTLAVPYADHPDYRAEWA